MGFSKVGGDSIHMDEK